MKNRFFRYSLRRNLLRIMDRIKGTISKSDNTFVSHFILLSILWLLFIKVIIFLP